MGAKVSRATRLMKKPLETRRRVDKLLENKPRPAPRHPTSQSALNEERKRRYLLGFATTAKHTLDRMM